MTYASLITAQVIDTSGLSQMVTADLIGHFVKRNGENL